MKKISNLFWLLAATSFSHGQAVYSNEIVLSQDIIQGNLSVGQPCNQNEDCLNYPETVICDPILSLCWCRDDHEIVPPEEGSGDPMVCAPIQNQIGDPCYVSGQCRKGEPGDLSDCLPSYEDPEQLVCNCSEGNIHEPGEHRCYPIRSSIGEECRVNAQCPTILGELVYCNEMSRRCKCIDDVVSSADSARCLKITHDIGGSCEEDNQCIAGAPGNWSQCQRSDNFPYEDVCLCKSEATNEPGEEICRKKAGSVGDPCLRNSQCKANLGNLSECLLGEVCVCTPGYGVPSMLGNRCLPVVNYLGGDCEERQQCTVGTPGPYSDCMESLIIPGIKICNCANGAINEPGRHECKRTAVFIGDSCEDDDQCVGEPGVSSACSVTTGMCRCLGGYVSSEARDDCLPIRNKIDDSCKESAQCQRGIPGPLSVCLILDRNDGICRCWVFSADERGQHFCHRRALLVGDPCQVHVQCGNLGELSHCLGENCECVKGAVPSSDKLTCVINS